MSMHSLDLILGETMHVMLTLCGEGVWNKLDKLVSKRGERISRFLRILAAS